MGRIILTIAGPWSKAPDLKTELETRFKPADREFAEDFVYVGRRADVLDDREINAILGHKSILQAAVEFEGSARAWAERGARLALDAMAAGAVGVFVETACKALSPHALKGLSPKDSHNLFHFYVEVLGDGMAFSTEGMQAFGMPEVKANYAPVNQNSAQAAVLSMAAQMVCDRLKPVDGGVFRASESAPLYEVTRGEAGADAEEDPYANPYRPWVLSLAH
jgi:hypothetical protein